MTKRQRDLTRKLAEVGIENIVISPTGRSHYRIDGTYQGRSIRLFASGTPRNPDHAIATVVRDARHAIRDIIEKEPQRA